MFKENKYTRWYKSIVENASKRQLNEDVYSEEHHIIPKSLGGTDDIDNLVNLTGREHFIIHWLLTKMVNDLHVGKMWNAFFMMHIGRDFIKKNSRTYELAKLKMAEHKKIDYAGENNPFYGKSHSKDTKSKMRENWNKHADRNVDNKRYTFCHDDYGIIVCTRKELCKTYNINQKRIYTIVNKKQSTALGWRIIWEKEVIS